ncbi:hexose transporter hxt1 [Myotisia sp. PD_48]|nr:hexose transporter hxt1 [Myotisia sp. PD_48]
MARFLSFFRSKSEDGTSSEKEFAAREAGNAGPVNTPIPRLTCHSVVMGIFVSMGGFIFGYDTGQISGILEMQNFLVRFSEKKPGGEEFHFSNVRAGLIVAMLSVGTLIGALIAGPVADRIGRKWSISAWCIVLHIGLIVQMTAESPKWYQVVVGRWIAGLGVGSLSLLVPLYQGESSPRHIRGAMVSTYQLFITLGIFVANCINFGTEARSDTSSWRIPMGVTFIWVLILGIGIIFFPETPRYDYRHNKVEKAKRTMMKLYGIPENHVKLREEFEEIQQGYEEEIAGKNEPWYSIFRAPTMPYRLALGIVLQALQQLTGANYFFYYGTVVFKGAGLDNSYVTQMILGAVNFGSTFLGLYNIEHFGRRKSLIAGSIWMFICFLVVASVGHFQLDLENPQSTPEPGKIMVVFSCLFIVGYASTWGPMVWAIVAELYPSRYRAKAMAMATASNWLWNFMIGFFTPFIVGDIDFMYGYVFAGALFLSIFVVYFGVIEGKGRTLEELDTMYVTGVKPWKSSNQAFGLLKPGVRAGEQEKKHITKIADSAEIQSNNYDVKSISTSRTKSPNHQTNTLYTYKCVPGEWAHTSSDPFKPPEPQPGEILYVTKGNVLAWGGTAILELLPSGDVTKTPIPNPYWPAEERDHHRDMELEARVYETIGQHPRVPKILSWDPESRCLTMEHLHNGNLREYLREHNQEITLQLRLRWSRQATEGLIVLHTIDIIHCDISPRNFLLDLDLNLKICDFGGASLRGAEPSATPDTRFRHPAYDFNAPPTFRDDIFSLGSLIYFIMTGSSPHEEVPSDAVESLYQAQEYPDVTHIICGSIISQCWHRETLTAQEVHAYLENVK